MVDELNPFVYDDPLPPDALIDRDEETRKLLSLAEGGHNTRLSAPRRYGKTSIILRLLAEADRAGLHTVHVDFYRCVTRGEAARRIEEAYLAALAGPLRRTVSALTTVVAHNGEGSGRRHGRAGRVHPRARQSTPRRSARPAEADLRQVRYSHGRRVRRVPGLPAHRRWAGRSAAQQDPVASRRGQLRVRRLRARDAGRAVQSQGQATVRPGTADPGRPTRRRRSRRLHRRAV